jgi:hypothetical protein
MPISKEPNLKMNLIHFIPTFLFIETDLECQTNLLSLRILTYGRYRRRKTKANLIKVGVMYILLIKMEDSTGSRTRYLETKHQEL